jgi:hypothetical protein
MIPFVLATILPLALAGSVFAEDVRDKRAAILDGYILEVLYYLSP